MEKERDRSERGGGNSFWGNLKGLNGAEEENAGRVFLLGEIGLVVKRAQIRRVQDKETPVPGEYESQRENEKQKE